MANVRTEKTIRQAFGLSVDTAVPGWEGGLVGRLDKAQWLQVMDSLRSEEGLVRVAIGELLRHPLSETELSGLVSWSKALVRCEVVRRLLALEPTAKQLADAILWCKDRKLRRAAGTELLRRNPSNADLHAIILHVADPSLVAAAVERWDRAAHPRDVVHVLRYNRRPALAQHFWQILLQSPEHTASDISYVMNFTSIQAIRNQAAVLLLADPELDLDRLSYVARRSTDRAVVRQACDRLLARRATNSFQLISVIEKHPEQSVRTRVAQQLLQLKPTSKHFKQLGADTIYAHILCCCRDAAVCASAWEKFRAIEPVSRNFLEFISKKGKQPEHRQAAALWAAGLPA